MKLEIDTNEIKAAVLDYYNNKLGTTFNTVDFRWSCPNMAELSETDKTEEQPND
jgi:hypothetical protein